MRRARLVINTSGPAAAHDPVVDPEPVIMGRMSAAANGPPSRTGRSSATGS
jgi:hypothetical protein